MFEQVFHGLFKAVAATAKGKNNFRFKYKLVSVDSTVIDLCLSMYDWAKFRLAKDEVTLGELSVRDHQYIKLDPSTMTCAQLYRISLPSRNKLASPRGFEPRLPP